MRSGARGSALAWGMIAVLVMATAVALVAGALGRSARIVRRAVQSEGERALLDSGFVLGRRRLAADRGWRGPERLDLAQGSAMVEVGCEEGRGVLVVHATARGGAPRTASERLRTPCPPP